MGRLIFVSVCHTINGKYSLKIHKHFMNEKEKNAKKKKTRKKQHRKTIYIKENMHNEETGV